jgi:hypothetical protein
MPRKIKTVASPRIRNPPSIQVCPQVQLLLDVSTLLFRRARSPPNSPELRGTSPPAHSSPPPILLLLPIFRWGMTATFANCFSCFATLRARILPITNRARYTAASPGACCLKKSEHPRIRRVSPAGCGRVGRPISGHPDSCHELFPKLIEGKTEGDPLRVWVPGCSTGEEAYSIAIVLAEYLGDRLGKIPVQIFATDLSELAIEQAKAGLYSGTTLAEVRPERLSRFFVKSNGNYRVIQSIRDMCTFARQDLTQDPPSSRIDLISCRNVLIYLEPLLQKRIIAAFHYALKDKGFLVLGKSETLNAFPDLFTLAEKKGKFYRKRVVANNPQFRTAAPYDRTGQPCKPVKPAPPPADLQREADRIVWSRYEHAGVIVDENLQILHFRGDTSPYVAPASRAASLHLLKMIRSELLVELRAAFQRSKKENAPVRKEGIRVTSGGQSHSRAYIRWRHERFGVGGCHGRVPYPDLYVCARIRKRGGLNMMLTYTLAGLALALHLAVGITKDIGLHGGMVAGGGSGANLSIITQ